MSQNDTAFARKIPIVINNLFPERQKALNLALVDAVKKDDDKQVHHLVQQGANPNYIDERSFQGTSHKTLLHNACLNGWTKAGMALLHCGAHPHLYTYVCGNTVPSVATQLHYAAMKGNAVLVEALLDAGANPHAPKKAFLKEYGGQTALHYAAEGGHIDVVTLLLARGLFPSANDAAQQTPLHLACENGHVHCASLLIQAGANPNMVDDDGNAPLFFAADALREGKDKKGDTVRTLVAFGAEPIVFNQNGHHPAHGLNIAHVRIFRKAVEEGLKLRAEMKNASTSPKTPPNNDKKPSYSPAPVFGVF